MAYGDSNSDIGVSSFTRGLLTGILLSQINRRMMLGVTVGTAAGIGLIISLPAAITMLTFGVTPSDAPFGTYGLVNLLGFVCIVPLTVIFAPMGAKLASILDANLLKRVFAVVLLITGLRMLAQLFI